MLFRHEFIDEALAYIPYMRAFNNGKVDLVGQSTRRTWHDANLIRYINKGNTHGPDVRVTIDNIIHNEYGYAELFDHRYLGGRSERYYTNGVYHRKDAPATIWYNDDESIRCTSYYTNGKYHREKDGSGASLPAVVTRHASGQPNHMYYYTNGLLHREDGPADIMYNADGTVFNQTWWKNGKWSPKLFSS